MRSLRPTGRRIIANILPFLNHSAKKEQVKNLASENAEKFYEQVLNTLLKHKIPFMVAGTYAFSAYTGIRRETKDFDIFVKGGNYQKILEILKNEGYRTEITDARWLAKVLKNGEFVDIIFGDISGLRSVDETWFGYAPTSTILDKTVKVLPVEELIWSKSYRMDREKYEGPDINHLILAEGENMDWKRLLQRMDQHWELLLGHLINFRFVYPSERKIIPKWLMIELLERVHQQFRLPSPKDKICRGPLLSRYHYTVDIDNWGFQDTR